MKLGMGKYQEKKKQLLHAETSAQACVYRIAPASDNITHLNKLGGEMTP